MQEKKEELTLGKIFKVIFRRKAIFSIVTSVVLLLGMIFILFIYNPQVKYYSAMFDYTIAGLDNARYIDNSKFDFRSIVFLDNLQAVQKSNKEFESIDVENMYEKGGIAVFIVEVKDEVTNEVTKKYYQIDAQQKYFSSRSQARKFIDAVCSSPCTKTFEISKKMVFTSNLDNFDSAQIYENQITLLSKQYDLIYNNYSELIADYGDLVLSNGKKISDFRNDIYSYFQDYNLESLRKQVLYEGLVKDYEDYKNRLELQITELDEEFQVNVKLLDELKSQRDSLIQSAVGGSGLQNLDLSEYNSRIIQLTNRNIEIEKEKEIINRKLSNTSQDNKDFETKLNTFRDKLVEFTTDFTNNYQEVIEQNCTVYYSDGRIITGEGGIGLIISAALSLFAGVICAAIINLILDRKLLTIKNVEAKKDVVLDEPKEEEKK